MFEPVPIEFEAALAELEQIVETLERGGPNLSEALAGYGRGVVLLGQCQGVLDRAERSVALLTGVDDAGQPVTSPFDSAATAALSTPSPVTPVVAEVVAESVEVAPSPTPEPPASTIRKPKGSPPPSTIPEAPF